MRTFCTIITSNYFPYAAALYRSLEKIRPDEQLQVLVADEGELAVDPAQYKGIHIVRASEIYNHLQADQLYAAYGMQQPDALRWGLKPVLLSYLLHKGFDKVIFADCDLCFFNSYEFLFDLLNHHSILLTRSGTTRNPELHAEEFLSGFQYGQFNAGFVGASKAGLPALEWWARCCRYSVETNFEKGLFVDQKYLDAMPVLFPGTHIVRHDGCNIAFWNQHEYPRSIEDGELRISKNFPVVFVHFTSKYIPELLAGNDALILPLFREYEKIFEANGHSVRSFIPVLPEYKEPSSLLKLKHKLLLRTRIKRWLFRLSQ